MVAIVDDDISVRRSTRRLLQSAGLRAEAYASAEEFLGSRRVGETGCLLLDLRMPGMSGFELQRHLADASTPIPIVFFSAIASADEERQAMQAGGVQFLRKPVSKGALLLAIRKALSKGSVAHLRRSAPHL